MVINGFDCYGYPGDDAVAWLRQHGQFRVAGFYLTHAPGKPDKTWTKAVRQSLAAAGWGFFPTYVGLQEGDPNLSNSRGANDGQEATDLMAGAGFATSSVVYLDLEEGDVPTGLYADYVTGWTSAVAAKNFTPGLYCSHLVSAWALQHTPFVWSFHVPSGTGGQSYDPDNLPSGLIDPRCIATQYRQNIHLNGLTIPKSVDSGGLDLNLCAVADPSNLASVQHSLTVA